MQFRVPIVLASASPRRQKLLREIVSDFRVIVADLDEEALTLSDPWRTAESLAVAKASEIAKNHPEAIVIGGDTVVAIPDGNAYQQLSKPKDRDDAIGMLHRLSGNRHAVITGFAVVYGDEKRVSSSTAWVQFRALDSAEIEDYVDTGEPMDKAGGYAIQGGAAPFVSNYEGSIDTVIGLPVEGLRGMLSEFALLDPR